MKILLLLIFLVQFVACTSHTKEQQVTENESLINYASSLLVDHAKWPNEKPRKLSIQSIKKDNIPLSIQNLGYEEASVDRRLVLLFSAPKSPSSLEGIAISPDGHDPSESLKSLDFSVSSSDDQRIIKFKYKKTEQGAAANP